jgi:serine/threonine protein phosphatase 1
MRILRNLSRRLVPTDTRTARGKEGCRAYAVGDIHGRLDLLNQLIVHIEDDLAARPVAKAFVIFLGDLIDRGPDSAGVVERLRTYKAPGVQPVFLSGNHEEVMLRLLAGERGILSSWLTFGGAECAQSYGVDVELLRRVDEHEAIALLNEKVPEEHRTFLASFADSFRFGDYLFVHAGVRPGIPLEEQTGSDLRWIRDPFLSDDKEHGFVVVHGHTIVSEVEERSNRIGIDTGAYRSGVLTALAIEDKCRWYLSSQGTIERAQ